MPNVLNELIDLDTLIADKDTTIEGDAGYPEIQSIRSRLSKAMRKARRIAADDATQLYLHGNAKLVQVNKKMQEDIDSLDSLLANIKAITGIVAYAEESLGIFVPA